MKIGIMGGTFDPVHNGHLELAETARRQFALDEIWFLPNGNPPHKKLKQIESDVKQRVEMERLAIDGHPGYLLEPCEAERKEVSCSYKTMEYLAKEHPGHEFYFIIGADSLFAIEKWVHPEKLFPLCTILAAYRDDFAETEAMGNGKACDVQEYRKEIWEEMSVQIEHLRDKYGAHIELLRSRPVKVSSSRLREMVHGGEEIHGLVPERVEEYIAEEGLYES